MPRGPKKHLKRLAAPRSWMLGKLGGVFTVKPSSEPHKQGVSSLQPLPHVGQQCNPFI